MDVLRLAQWPDHRLEQIHQVLAVCVAELSDSQGQSGHARGGDQSDRLDAVCVARLHASDGSSALGCTGPKLQPAGLRGELMWRKCRVGCNDSSVLLVLAFVYYFCVPDAGPMFCGGSFQLDSSEAR